ncbi:sulfatase-like hydrolase/transferase [Tunturiibacter gelidiferens]|uniref:sulfatase-like hydrolase/transferase n=1 Tax=Tunturiibacter gelidiferens TaxID=3069689 RepID=UPI003D9B567E
MAHFDRAISCRTKTPRLWLALWLGLIVLGPWMLLKIGAKAQAWPLPHWISRTLFFGSILSLVAIAMCWQPSFVRTFQRIQRFATTLLDFTAIFGAITISQLLWCLWQARELNTPISFHQRLVETALTRSHAKPRIIWILLDELSYEQVYEHRFVGLDLPAFDRIAQQSTVFTHVVPAGIMTENVIPSLMTGLPVDRIRSSADRTRLSLHDPVSNHWHFFDQHETIFQDALNAGYSTAVTGWFNPYCRILPSVIDRCYWTSHQLTPTGSIGDASITANALAPLRDSVESTLKVFSTVDDQGAELHISDYRELLEAADEQLKDSSSGFLFLHMPVPHPGGIYDRRTGRFALNESSYIDNLALADRYLDHVYQLLTQRNEWDSSMILIMGDHSWRTQLLWAESRVWTAEDQAASHGGKFDDRPAYIVKMPHQNQPLQVETPFQAIRTRALLQGFLNSQIHSAEDLTAFAAQDEAP